MHLKYKQSGINRDSLHGLWSVFRESLSFSYHDYKILSQCLVRLDIQVVVT